MGLFDHFSPRKRAEAAQLKALRERLAPIIENRVRFTNKDGVRNWHAKKGVSFQREITPQGAVTYITMNHPKLGRIRARAAAVSPRYDEGFVDFILQQSQTRVNVGQATRVASNMKTSAIAVADRSGPDRLAQIKAALSLNGATPFPGGWEGMITYLKMVSTTKPGMQNLDFIETNGRGYFGTRVAHCQSSPAETHAMLQEIAAEFEAKTGRRPSFALPDRFMPGAPILLRDRSFVEVTQVFPDACTVPKTGKPPPIPLLTRLRGALGLGTPVEELRGESNWIVFSHRMNRLSGGLDWQTTYSLKVRSEAGQLRNAVNLKLVEQNDNDPKPTLAPVRPRPALRQSALSADLGEGADFAPGF